MKRQGVLREDKRPHGFPSVHSPATVQDWRNTWLMLQTNAIFRSNRVCHLFPLRFCLSGEFLTVWMIDSCLFWSKKGIMHLLHHLADLHFLHSFNCILFLDFKNLLKKKKLMFWIWLIHFFLMFSPSRHLDIVSSVLTKWHCPKVTSSWNMSSSVSPNQ